ncbi:hypothetical protein V6N11_061171 [Hibiscus sabdariffa]|uniref:Ammonium transporter AmtB-like domain-containing protein n=2 Tax=Hibiscus sabdariffa TaxID=183260 RepID=A0ABR2AXA7_9ROSI
MLMLAGNGLLWLGRTSFNGGDPSKSFVIGATQSMISGLVCITPAEGVVQGWAAILMGMMFGSIPWYTVMVLHEEGVVSEAKSMTRFRCSTRTS